MSTRAVAALLVHKAVGDQLTCVFVDHGLLRKGEAEQVVETFDGVFHVPLVHVQAQERFLARLAGVTDPEQKRKIIGEEFIRVFEDEARKLGDVTWLVQGTLYSDVIESGGTDGVAETIKSHHNVGGLPDDMKMKLVEPLRLLFKDEVRRVGEELGMPERMVWRQPFPGPGLAIRIIGDVTEERLETLREADSILQDEVRKAGLYRELWQSFCVLPAIRSVGVQGDSRTYGYPIAIRAVTSEDAMTADWARLPVRPDRADLLADRQRDPGGEPRRARRHVEAARHDRVGVGRASRTGSRPSVSSSGATSRGRAAAQGRGRLEPRAPAAVDAVGPVRAADARREGRAPAQASAAQFDRDENFVYGVFSRDESRLLGGSGLHRAGRRRFARDRLLGARRTRPARGSRRR